MRAVRIAAFALAAAIGTVACGASPSTGSPSTALPSAAASPSEADAELIRTAELELHAALLAGDVDAAGALLADDYELVDPAGDVNSKPGFLDLVESGTLEYLDWTIESPMEVRMHGDAAVVRFRSTIAVNLNGTFIPGEFWHTDYYENVDGRWLATWAQTTPIL